MTSNTQCNVDVSKPIIIQQDGAVDPACYL